MTRTTKRRLSIFANVVMVAIMVGLVSYSPTLYRLFCAATGYGGTVRRAPAPDSQPTAGLPTEAFTVLFDSNVAPGLNWEFRPEQTQVDVQVGVPTQISYYAKNLSDHPVVAHAVFNVSPYSVAPYFYKIQCFCFTDEKLQPGEEAHMPVVFYIDQTVMQDPEARALRRVTLSYTFYAQDSAPGDLDATRSLSAGSDAEAVDVKKDQPLHFDNDAPRS